MSFNPNLEQGAELINEQLSPDFNDLTILRSLWINYEAIWTGRDPLNNQERFKSS
jgi:hypothetical protein